MANKNYRYEAIVKLSNGAAVPYHNINTGLKKFHVFVETKFKGDWLFWTARRIKTKEIVGTYTNDVVIHIKAIRLFLPKQRNDNNSGYFVRFPFKRQSLIINRNLFFSDSVILEVNDNFIVLNELILKKAIQQAKNELTNYYTEKGHLITNGEIKMGEFENQKILITKKQSSATQPMIDYP